MAKEPLQALLFAPNHWFDIISGHQLATIREGTINYRVNKPVMLCCHIANMCLMADVTKITQCLLEDIPDLWLLSHAYPPLEYLSGYMQKYYPNITDTSPVTIVEWNNIRGSVIGYNQ